MKSKVTQSTNFPTSLANHPFGPIKTYENLFPPTPSCCTNAEIPEELREIRRGRLGTPRPHPVSKGVKTIEWLIREKHPRVIPCS